ncbi:hypothetical protein GPECTOR_47g339 [Gonium pectorale]|uniref:PIH1 N-terminal domain-containing protein n=1 Tax=Gonium pectorale TaxID=33097 RepID=A0A150G8A4_GONPE|nr:hypothetical protein GPECTOR_47g339 [Gonium pectorale]|eukprot:KXZ46064.1 hypothetical protein GPECTOR_47g339 [Gonium pectorale]
MGDEQLPSPEELLAMLEMLQQQGVNMDQVPPDLKTLLDNVKRQKSAKGGAAPQPDVPTEEITPEPGFVIKTSDTASGMKVFINVCSHDRVAAPGGWAGGVMPDEVATALEKMQGADGDAAAAAMSAGELEALRFPLAAGPPRPDADRQGQPCSVADVVFNTDVVRAAAAARRLKALLIEIAMGHVGSKLGLSLDERYKLPKMRYKGEVVASQRIRADDKRKKLVTELRDIDEEPSFPLRPTKAPQPPPPAPQQQAKVAAAAAGPGPGSAAAASAASAGRATAPPAAAGTSGKAAATSPAPSSAAALMESGPGRGAGGVKVEYEGRPVEWIRVTLDLPPDVSRPTGPSAAAGLAVEVAGRSLFVRCPGHPELTVPLLFAASAGGAAASAEVQPPAAPGAPYTLVIRLPYKSLDEHLADAQAQAPLSFGQLSFASRALLELEP